MIKLEIVEKKGEYEYCLEDDEKHEYKINLDFLDIEEKPKTGDYIFIHEELLDTSYEGYNASYTFGNLENKYGKENIKIDDIDVIKIAKDNIEIYLKRLYG
jgi:hypothetical protein